MDLREIVREEIDDSLGKRIVYLWKDTREEIRLGLYESKVKRNTFMARTFRKEVFVARLQGEEEIHQMYVAAKIRIDNLPEIFEISKHRFYFMNKYNQTEAAHLLGGRLIQKG